MPLLMALCVVIGIIIGTFYTNHFSGNRLNIINSGSNRLNNLLHIIDDQYVDKVNIDSLVDMAIPQILADLDPHSVYISAKDVQQATDDLKGSFSGVGIEFVIREDTIHVQGVIKNGPADQVGIRAGDKIVSVDGKPFVGKKVTNSEAMRRLKGPKDTKVKIGVIRYGEKKVRQFTVTRGDIPQKSVNAAYMLDDETGYIKIKNFGENTYNQFTSVPIRIGYSQDLIGYNAFRWERKIEPLKFEKVKKEFLYNMEAISEQATTYFFQLAMAQVEYDMAKENVASTDTLYRTGQERHKIAAISQEDLLTLRLDAINARNTLKNTEIALKRAMFSLASYLNFDKNKEIRLRLPSHPRERRLRRAAREGQGRDGRLPHSHRQGHSQGDEHGRRARRGPRPLRADGRAGLQARPLRLLREEAGGARG